MSQQAGGYGVMAYLYCAFHNVSWDDSKTGRDYCLECEDEDEDVTTDKDEDPALS
jgi:hypothetical protein